MSDSFTYLEVEAALCVWECINDMTLGDSSNADWIALRDGIGSMELRHQSIALGQWCLAVYDECNAKVPDCFEGMAYDWEVIPKILEHAMKDGKPAIYAEHLPPAESVAPLVLQWVAAERERWKRERAFSDWIAEARREALRQWCFADLIERDSERVKQAYKASENIADFVKSLGEKYDLTPVA